MNTLGITVVIPTLDRQVFVERFLDSLNRQTLRPNEVIIVDASSESYEARYRQRLDRRVALVYRRSAPGLTRQRNRGIDLAKGDLIVFFDDDIVLESDYLRSTLNAFERPENRDVAVVYGRITNPPINTPSVLGTIHRFGNTLISTLFFLPRLGNGRFQPSGFPTMPTGRTGNQSSEYMPGGLTAYRADIIRQFRFDERLASYAYMEDDDVGYRISRQHTIIYCPNARCSHLPSNASRISPMTAGKMLIINHHYLWRKNFPHRWPYRLAHTVSLIGYPLLQLWNLQGAKFLGSMKGLASIIFRLDPLSRLAL